MSEFMQGLLSGGVGTLVLAVVALVLEHRRHRTQIQEERAKTSYPDLLKAYVDFANTMREAQLWHARYEDQHGIAWADERQPPDGDYPDRYEPQAEKALGSLRLLDDDELYQAARAYLDEHYRVHWGPLPGEPRRGTDLVGRETAFIRAAQKRLRLGA